MPVYIDPPLWPAHGTRFSHLVSDTSYEELHAFADGLGVPRRAFDRDHYDVRESLYREAVAAGAVPVDGRQLTRVLVRSGLRVPARARPERIARVLVRRWAERFPAHPALGRELVDRWAEPHRHYHGPAHLLAVLEAVDRLRAGLDPARLEALVLAAWFHDAVYRGRPGTDERESADLARARLGAAGLPEPLAAEVERLVLLTVDHRVADDDTVGGVLLDADLSVLGADPAGYATYAADVRKEYANVPDPVFAGARLRVLEDLRRRQPLFRTPEAQRLWGAAAARNLDREIGRLRAARTAPVDGSSGGPPADVEVLTITAVCLQDDDGALLTVRKRGTERFMLVGGKLDPGESPAAAAVREAAEEVGLRLETAQLRLLGEFEAPAANESGTWVRCTVYTAPLAGRPAPLAEIEELRWQPLDDASAAALPADLAPLLREHVIPALRRAPGVPRSRPGRAASGGAGSR
ncbi:DUF4031 domain-containing protein [Kocuria sp. M1N1S27]|uniref:DUF4031 domain-containing protein n=1 Tax=Kocuria kalidii TaxID=3376283 RepID=UPI00378B2A92